MSKSILFLVILTFITANSTQAQYILLNYELGYNANFVKPKGPNLVVNEYNSTRSFLITEMDEFSFFDGFTAEIGLGLVSEYSYSGLYIGIGYNGSSQKSYAEGSTNGIDTRRDVKITDRSIYGSLGIISTSSNENAGLIFGAKGELAFVKIKTKVGNNDWEKTDNNAIPYFSPFIKIMVNRFIIEPYYRFELFKSDTDFGVEGLNKEINPNTANPDPSFGIPYGGNSFGVRLTVDLFYGV